QVVQEGQDLLQRIIRIDPQRRRMGLSLRRALDTPDADLEAVFGEGILEERDALQAKLHEALEAEGLIGTRQDEPEPEVAEVSPESAEIDIQEAGEAQVAAFQERAARAEKAAAKRPARSRKKEETAEEAIPQSFGDESGMSA